MIYFQKWKTIILPSIIIRYGPFHFLSLDKHLTTMLFFPKLDERGHSCTSRGIEKAFFFPAVKGLTREKNIFFKWAEKNVKLV